MAAPIIALATKAYSASTVDLTALTSQDGVWTIEQGYDGADWVYPLNFATASITPGNEWNIHRKRTGGRQIVWVNFDELNPGDDWSLYMQTTAHPRAASYEGDDDIVEASAGATNSSGHQRVMIGTQIPCGMEFQLPADQNLRTFTFYGRVNDFAGVAQFEVQAEFDDGSYAPTTMALARSANGSDFTCQYRSLTATTLRLRITLTVPAGPGAEDYAFIDLLAATIDAYVPPAKPRGFRRYLSLLGLFGGANDE
jgi:hypothetical protein